MKNFKKKIDVEKRKIKMFISGVTKAEIVKCIQQKNSKMKCSKLKHRTSFAIHEKQINYHSKEINVKRLRIKNKSKFAFFNCSSFSKLPVLSAFFFFF